MTEERLTRIEQKLDKLSEAVVSLARMEERMVTLFNRMDSYDLTQQRVVDRVTDLEKKVVNKTAVMRLGEKGVWLIVGAFVSYIVWLLRTA